MELDKTMLNELTSGCKTPQDVEKLFSQMLRVCKLNCVTAL
ncbi:hypothetical protein [Xanthomonas oryzae]|nr:hypothetical protein [Xanthomonas oryzae]UWZ71495.1 transposase [Xanthomonas oryzae pv. oryzae]